jgi:hypothetical protein
LNEEISNDDIFSLTTEYVKKIEDTNKEKDIYDETYQKDSYSKFKKKLIELNNKLKADPRSVGKE